MEKHVVVVSRDWHNPQIVIDVTDTGIGVSMPLSDFITAVATEVGSPALLMTNAALLGKLTDAAAKVTAGMKQETVRVM